MKKWLIALCVLFGIGAVAAAVTGYQLNTRYGWMASTPVSHDALAPADTRLRVAIDGLRLSRAMEPYLPGDVSLPKWLPWDLPTLIPRVMPREIALLGHSDFRSGEYKLMLFINEQRGGPILPPYLNSRTGFRQRFPAVTWEDPGFTLEGRGVLRARGYLELPPELEATIRDTWPAGEMEDTLTLLGGHLAEGVIDNRGGEIVTLIGALAPVWGTSLGTLEQDPQFAAAMALLAGVLDLRAAVDFESTDALLIQIRVNAEPDVGGQLEFLVPLVFPSLAKQVQQKYGLVMSTEYAWKAEENTYVVDITLAGVEQKLTEYFQRTLPRRAPATG